MTVISYSTPITIVAANKKLRGEKRTGENIHIDVSKIGD